MIIELGARFPAKWDNKCPTCARWWWTGEQVGFINDTVMCMHCYDSYALEQEWQRYFAKEV